MSQIDSFLDGNSSTSDVDNFLNSAPAKPAGAIRKLADVGLSVAKGVIGVPEAAVGLANLVTKGHAGKLAESAGIRFKDAKDVLSGLQSDDFKSKQKQFQDADGILDKTGVALSNPSLVANAVAESLPLMGAGGVAARGLMTVAPKIGAVGAGALGEGIAGAGAAGEQTRQETSDGLLTGKQAALAGASGGATALFGAAGGKLAQKLGIGDIDTMIARGTNQVASGTQKGVIRRMAEGALSEGALEELPQSLSEQALQNIALDRPVTQGLEDAGVMGALAGGVMGAGAGAISRTAEQPQPTVPQTAPTEPPPQLGNTPDPYLSFADGTVARKSEFDAYVNGLPPDQKAAALAKVMGLAPQPAKPSEAMGLDPATGPMSAAAAMAVDTGVHEGIKLDEANAADQAAYEQATNEQAQQAAQQDTANQSVTKLAEKQAEAQLSEEDKRAVLYSNQPVLDGGTKFKGAQDGDILNGMQAPYSTYLAAARRAHMEGKDWQPVKIGENQFVARRKDAHGSGNTTQSSTGNSAPVQPTDTAGAVATGSGATAGSTADTARANPDDVVPAAVNPSGVPDGAVNEQNPQTPPLPAPVEAPGKAPQAVEGNAAAPAGLPAKGTGTVEGDGVAKETVKVSKSVNSSKTDMTLDQFKTWVDESYKGFMNQPVMRTGKGDKGLTRHIKEVQKHSGIADALRGVGFRVSGFAPVKPDDAEIESAFKKLSQPNSTPTASGTSTPTGNIASTEPASTGNIATAAPSIDDAAHTAATSKTNDLPQPTEAQKQAGNYPKGHVNLNGLDLSIENPAGSVRSGKDKTGKAWSNTLQHHYGYIKGTIGNDKDHVDLFVKPGTPLDYSGQVFVIDQIHPDTGRFDEHKVVVGAKNGLEARRIYQANYAKGWNGFKAMTAMPFDQFKTWVKDGPKNKPLSSEKQDSQPQGSSNEEAPKAIEDPAKQQAPAAAGVAPGVRTATEHAGVKIYPVTFKGEPRWSVQTSANKISGKVLGDTIHTTLDDAKKEAELQVARDKSQAERNAAHEAEQAAAQAKKDANKGKSLAERKRDFDLDKPTKLHPNAGLGIGTRREAMQKAVDQDRHIESATVRDEAAKKRDTEAMDRARRNDLPTGNINYPGVKEYFEAAARLKADKYEKPEYRVYDGRDNKGSFREITKTEYDYAQELKATSDVSKNAPEMNTSQQPVQKTDKSVQVEKDAKSEQPASEDAKPVNDRDSFTLERLNQETGKMEPVTFARGEYVQYTVGGNELFGDIDGISQARKEFSVDGLWYPFGFAYKADRPAEVKPPTVPLSKVLDAVNKKHGQGLTDADAVPQAVDVLDAETALWSRITEGVATVDEFKAGFARWVDGKDEIIALLSKNTKDQLLKMRGLFYDRYKNEPKAELVSAMWRDGTNRYVLGRSFSHGMGKNAWLDGIRNMVEATEAEQLAQYAKDRKSAEEEAVARVAKTAEAIKDPKTLSDFQTWMRATMGTGKTFKEARLMLTPEQRAQFDDLTATASRAERATSKEAKQDAILRAPGEAVTATEIIKTRHTKHGHDLWQFNLEQRVSGEEFKSLVTQAKRLGGDYSSYRGNGAIPGWQFRTEDAAKAFKALIAGDTTAAKDVMQERRDAFADDRSQSAAERLVEMADRLDERAEASLNQERKQNTDKRARQAASAEAAANAGKAMAKTMRNMAQAIADGKAKFLDRVRQKVQVEALLGYVTTAHHDALRAKYESYAEQERHRGEAPTMETADFAEFPTFTAYRSDLATLARQLVEVDGTKKLGQQLLKVADDVSDAYLKFAKENFHKVSTFSTKTGGLAAFSTKDAAEAAIARSGYKGKAIAYQVKRGEHTVIMSPSEAIERGIWQGDGDKRISLSGEFATELVEKIGKAARRGSKVSVPWQLETAHDRRKVLERMGIETPAEFRAALREFIGLREQAEAPNKVKQLERAMVGRRNDGLDFFPTPESVADEMVATAGIEPGMAVLEPSAGWGHIAERIQAAGVDPDVGELSEDRRELLEAKGFRVVTSDFMNMEPRKSFTWGDVYRAPDGVEGIMRGLGGLGSNRVRLEDESENRLGMYDRDELTPVRMRGVWSGYDRIIMNPPFSDGRDIQHVQHAYTLLRPGGRIVAIMGESAFTNQNKRAAEFREWLDSVGGTYEKLAEGSFNDPSLPVNTGANARMVVIDKETDKGVAMFSRANDAAGQNALQAMSDNDELFAMPKSDKDTVEGIAADTDPDITVKKSKFPGLVKTYVLTMPDGGKARLMVRGINPYGAQAYGMIDNPDGESPIPITDRPGNNTEAVPDDVESVYIDVSALKEGGDGGKIYNIAATFAHNTGRILIGDPMGLSDAAMRRRTEHMLSSALKFGTTQHLAPHPRQVDGASSIGVPPLRWTYGDDLGNIKSLIQTSLASFENAVRNPIEFDPDTGAFRDSAGRVLDEDAIQLLVKSGRSITSRAGVATYKRSAVLRALVREEGSESGTGGPGAGVLAQLVAVGRQFPSASKGIFYSRSASATGLTATQVSGIVNAIRAQWSNAPEIIVAHGMADTAVPQRVRDYDQQQKSLGATGEPEGFVYRGKVYLMADQLTDPQAVMRVLFHEALGHLGLRGVFGDKLDGILKQLAVLRRADVAAKAKQYGLDMSIEADRMQAAEEVLAVLAQTKPEMGFVQRAIAAIRNWLRTNVPGFSSMKLTDADIVANFITPARRFIEGKGQPGGGNIASQLAFGRGTSDTAPDSGGAMFSRSLGASLNDAANNVLNERKTKIVGEAGRQYTPAQLAAMKAVGFQVELPSLKDRAQALWQDAGKKLAQGIVDQFAPIKDIDKDAYGLLRLAKGASGAFEVFMHGGQLKLEGGVYNFDEGKRGGVVEKLLQPLQTEHHDFFRWVAANRAERLMEEGKENLFSKSDIASLKTLAEGATNFDYTIKQGLRKGQVTRDRALIYADSLKTFNEFQNNVLDMAEQSGLIDGEARKLWEHEFYVPFYRIEDDGSVAGAHIKNGVVRQQAFKSLTGRVNKLNADLMDNTLMNWAHLLDASAKNRAAKATIEAVEKMGAAIPLEGSAGKGSVWFRENGQKRWALIDDPMLLTAVSALEYAGMRNPVMDAMGMFKRALTIGVTASPFFKIRNLIRDSVQVLGTSKINPNPAINIARGWKLTDPKSDAYFRLLAGGGTIHFGTMLEGSESKRVQALVESGVDDSTILGDEHKVKAFYRKFIEPGITAYNELGNRGEAINRASLYDQLVRQGMSHAEASLQARDLMDFSMQGSFTSIRFLTQVVPFFNARLQGIYKLGRAANEDPARFGAVIGATAMFSIALLAAYSDDDDWKKREEWDRNNYWWFKFGGTAFRIPKPFEIGAMATLAERGFELAFDKEMTGSRFGRQVATLLGDNLSMNPVPQLVKPIVDVYANKNSFSGRPIETMGMERLKSEYRFTDRTSMVARGLSTAANSVAGLVGGEALSPVQIDHMLRGYFGWLGSFIVGTADKIARPATGQNEHPSSDMWKTLTGGIVSDMRDAPSRYVSQMYEQAREIEQAYGTWRTLQKEGKAQEAAEFAQDNQEKLSKYHFIERIKRQEASANQRIRMIERSEMDSDSKRELIRKIQVQKDQIARRISA